MRSLAILLGCAAVGWWIIAEYRRATREAQQREAEDKARQEAREQWDRAYTRIMRDIFAEPTTEPRVVESKFGVFIRASCPEEAAEIVSQSTAFNPRAA